MEHQIKSYQDDIDIDVTNDLTPILEDDDLSVVPLDISEDQLNWLEPDLPIDLLDPEMQGLPPRIFTEQDLPAIIRRIVDMLGEIDVLRANAYHNRRHAVEVCKRVLLIANDLRVPFADVQLLCIAALFHDYDHFGKDVRADGSGLSNEEVAAIAADRFMKKLGMNLDQRQTVYDLILSTDYFGRKDLKRTELQFILGFADVSGYMKKFKLWLDEAVNVVLEMPPEKRPRTIEEWNDYKKKFLLNLVATLLPKGISSPWEKLLMNTLTKVENLTSDYVELIETFLRTGKWTFGLL